MSDAVAEIADLRALLTARDAELATARAELTGARLLIAQYQAQLAKLRRMQFGRSSERLDAEIRQLELLLEDLEEGEAAHTAPARLLDAARPEGRHPRRRPLPDHLPRETIVHPAGDRCPECGGLHFSALGEDVTEIWKRFRRGCASSGMCGRSSPADPARPSSRRRLPTCRSPRVGPGRDSWSMLSFPSTSTAFHFTASRPSCRRSTMIWCSQLSPMS